MSQRRTITFRYDLGARVHWHIDPTPVYVVAQQRLTVGGFPGRSHSYGIRREADPEWRIAWAAAHELTPAKETT